MASRCLPQTQKRKISRRSRFGCRNCKLRKLKCDEDKPQCKRCTSFGLLCNFMTGAPDMQPIADDSSRPWVVRGKAEPRPSLTNAIWTSDAATSYQLNTKCQDFITRYLRESLINPDDPRMAEVNRELFALTFTHPHLMHASIAVALAYDHYLNKSSSGCRTLEECYHVTQSTSLLNKRLRAPVELKDKDAIWGTAAALAIVAFASPDISTSGEAWPLKPSDSSDLEWLRMNKGKMSLWRLVNPLRPDSLFRVMAATYAQMNLPMPEQGIDGIPRALALVCHLDGSSTAENNPYFNAAHAVSLLQCLPASQVTVGVTEHFTHSIHGPFQVLLREKDPVALLLLYLWYREAGRGLWFIESRARVERPAICSYLQLYHKNYDAVHAFLPGGHLAGNWSLMDTQMYNGIRSI